jgi:hypothetical protein
MNVLFSVFDGKQRFEPSYLSVSHAAHMRCRVWSARGFALLAYGVLEAALQKEEQHGA